MSEKIFYPAFYHIEHQEYPCLYFQDGRIASFRTVFPTIYQMEDYHLFMEHGYCRDSFTFFLPVCKGCRECVPMRLEVSQFKNSENQQRIAKKNRDIRVRMRKGWLPTEEEEDLYARYCAGRHPDRKEGEYSQALFNLHMGYSNSVELLYYLEGQLVGVSILDDSDDSISSAYFYWDPELKNRSLGVYSMLQEISYARQLGKKFLYVGFYIKDISNMAYKKLFRPAQVLVNSEWMDFIIE